MDERSVTMIIPAVGWYARFKEDGDELVDVPLACWALLDSGEICGMEAADSVQNVEDVNTFSCYFHESELHEVAKKESINARDKS